MKINQNKVVLLHYELSVDGKSVEHNDLDYIHGTHMLLPKFEQELEGLEPTQSFAFPRKDMAPMRPTNAST